MLTGLLFGAIFLSTIWLLYAFHFIDASLSGMSFFDAGIVNVLLYALFVCLPVFIIWSVFGFISQYLHNRTTAKQMFRLFSQMKKNQEFSDLLARIMLETEQNIKNSFILNRFDLMIADMNEMLSEFIQRERMASVEQIEYLWTKVQNGGKWSFGKVLIENYNRQPALQKKIFEDAAQDNLLAGTIMEFCARYQKLLTVLEKHDKEKIFLSIIETGVFGKVFAILAPVADEIRRSREAFASFEEAKSAPLQQNRLSDTELSSKPFQPKESEFTAKKTFGQKINVFFNKYVSSKDSKDIEPDAPKKDDFSLALERSFSEESPLTQNKEEPVFEISQPKTEPVFEPSEEKMTTFESEEDVLLSEEPVSDTKRTLDSLKREWKDLGQAASAAEQEQDLTYPFSGWTDAENYQK